MTSLLGVLSDITFEIDQKNNIIRNEFRFRNIFENSPLGKSITLKTGTMYVNKKFSLITGYTEKELNTMHWETITHPDDIKLSKHEIAKMQKSTEAVYFRKRYIHKKGHIVWTDVSSVKAEDPITGDAYFLTTINDVTKAVEREIELKASKALAEENESRLMTFINSIPDIVCYKDGKGQWLLANEADLELFCLEGVDYKGKTDKELAEYTNAIYRDAFLNCMVTDEKAWLRKTISNDIERIPTVDGEEKIYDVFKVPIFHKNGQRKGLAVIGRDITNLRKIQDELKTAKDRAELANVYKNQFLANMSHEIRTPMNGVVGFAQLLKNVDLDEVARMKYIDVINNNSKILLNLIDDIIDVAKIEAGEMRIEKTPFDVIPMLEDIETNFQKTKKSFKKQHIKVEAELPSEYDVFLIDTDGGRLRQVITNLLNNALKFTHKGRITFGFEVEENQVLFYVKDQGIGIPKDKQDSVFEHFNQIPNEDQIKNRGTGLGLAISKGIVELLDGKIWVEAEENKGSNFYFTLPFENLETTTSTEKKIKKKLNYNKILANKTFLIVEDDETNRFFFENVFIGFDTNILFAENGKEAIDIYKKTKQIDLVLMDIQMPVMGGEEADKAILAFDKNAKILAQTAFAMQGDAEHFKSKGFMDYISKPINIEELFNKLYLACEY